MTPKSGEALLRRSDCNHDVNWDERSQDYGVCKRCATTILLCDDCGHPEDDCICWYLAEIAAGERDDPDA